MTEAYQLGGGSGGPFTSTTQAYLIDLQCVTSHGNEAVPDASVKTTVNHSPGVAFLTPFNYDTNDKSTQKGLVHVPIHNPPAMTKAAYLQQISLKFDSVDGATVDSVILYYDSQDVFTADTKNKKTFYVSLNADESKSCAYAPPPGICVSLSLGFPNSGSCIKLWSVTLVYKAT